jgi:HSP20 family protein
MTTEERPTRALSPWRQMSQLQEEIDRLWESVWGGRRFPTLRVFGREAWAPAVDVFQREKTLVVKAELPGLTEKDIEITVTDDSLTLSGEKREEKEVREEDFYRCERSYGRFSRTVALPAEVVTDKASATFKDGVLEVVLPLKEPPKKTRVEVKAG